MFFITFYRYANTIAAQFFGHTHFDHFELYYDPESKKPISVGYISPSVTTFTGLNPGYRVYTVDGIHPNSTWVSQSRMLPLLIS